ncbi:toxin-antitoxin system, toxin component, PIN domain protein [Leptospira noguchii str. 2006001870]|nr:toxin-antitoxin system, toxin component, PIN domain protein [Leptospira noguchii str. 2006001870]
MKIGTDFLLHADLYRYQFFFLSIVFEDTNYKQSYETWMKDEYRFSSKLIEIESFINIHKVYRENLE